MSLIVSSGLSAGAGLSQTAGLYGGEGLNESYSAQAQQFLARITNPGPAQSLRYANLIDSLVTAGVWTKLDVLMVYAAPSSATALINLKSSSFASTLTLAPTFTAYQGFLTNGTNNYINTNYSPLNGAGNFSQNSGIAGFWSLTVGDTVGSMGTQDANGVSVGIKNGTSATMRLNGTTAVAGIVTGVSDGTGLAVSSRVGSATIQVYVNGIELNSAASTSATPVADTIKVGFRGTDAGVGSYSIRRFAASVVGGGLTATEHTALYNALLAYMQAVGAV